MPDLADHLHAVINEGILRGISAALEAKCYGSAVILIYAGIDSMAFLAMPENQEDVRRDDFVRWVESYLKLNSKNTLTGFDWYGARCGMLHNFGVYSRLYREGKARPIGYVDKNQDEIVIDKTGESSLALVSIEGLARAFKSAIELYFEDARKDPEKISVIEKRIQTLVQCSDLPKELRQA